MILKTLYSSYEVDLDSNRVRRLSGENPPTSWIGEDGVWRNFTTMLPPPEVGRYVWFHNNQTDPRDGFTTSVITEITP